MKPVALWIAMALGLAGCQKASEPAQRPKIAGIIFQDDQWMRLVALGMKQTVEKNGGEFVHGCTFNKPDKEVELISTYVTRGVNAIVITPISAEASVAALKLAQARGVKVITFNTKVNSDVPLAHVECSNESMGRQTGQAARRYIETKLGGQAKVAVMAFRSQLPEQSDARVNSFKAQLAGMAGVEFVAEQDGWLPEMALKKATDMLTAHPDLNVFYAANEGGCIGAALAVKNAGKAGRVGVFGIGSSEQIDAFLLSDDNIVQAVTDASPMDIGRLAAERALQAIRGEPVEKLTELPGVLVSRTDPDAVRKFDAELKKAIAAAGQ